MLSSFYMTAQMADEPGTCAAEVRVNCPYSVTGLSSTQSPLSFRHSIVKWMLLKVTLVFLTT